MHVYWTAECYGFGKWIRKYGYYPSWLPLCIYTDHAAGCNDNGPLKQELESDAPVQFYHCYQTIVKFREKSDKPCYPLFSPFVFARKQLRIEKNPQASGTVFFLAHTTKSIDDLKSITAYHEELQALPEKYHPVRLCLHINDVKKGVDQKFRDLGYEVFTAGEYMDPSFTERFYEIISGNQYAMSNVIGSHVYYCIEMGLPFGIYGDPPKLFNKSDPNIEKGAYSSYADQCWYQKGLELFGDQPDQITAEQREYVNFGLGLEKGISRFKMSRVLYKSLFVWLIKPENSKLFLKRSAGRLLSSLNKFKKSWRLKTS